MEDALKPKSDYLLSHCRICLRSGIANRDLFEESAESKHILNIINLCFHIIIVYDDHKPSNICSECIKELDVANNFRLKCISFDERFKILCEEREQRAQDYCVSPDISYNMDTITEPKNQIEENCFKCALCKKVLKTKISLLKHYVSMHEKRKHIGKVSGSGSDRRYHCTTCSYSSPHSQTLVNHMRRHNGERPYICECGKSFTQSSSLAAHRKTHSSVTYYTCSSCGKQFKHAFALKNHLQVHESATFSCNICYKTLKSKQSLQAHMHRHYNICNYSCEACGDTFVTSAELLNHRKKHNLEKKVECHLCGYKTHTKKT